MKNLKILIIIPAYNEEGSIQKVVESLVDGYPQYDYIVVNDGSQDATASICRKNGYQMLDLPINIGLAGVMQAGFRYAYGNGYDYALQFDGDGQHQPQYIEQMCRQMEEHGADIIIGSRFIEQEKPKNLRMVGSRIIQGIIHITTGKDIKDPTSGMRLFNRSMMKKFAYTMNYGPEPDTISFLIRCGGRVEETQVQMLERETGESYLNVKRSIQYMLHMCMSIIFIQAFRKKEGLE
ncbi:MAG: glycosyltransferase family 2 protein [Eubacterium sp.]|nr:glycosyltransferase family 2 protein [Eubacterium sp.]